MKIAAPVSIQRLRGQILRATSRSFYLSIRLLPGKLRDPIALAYLLARATDTIADTARISVALRTEQLAKLAALIQGEQPAAAAQELSSFAALQDNASERALIQVVPDCLRWLEGLSSEDRADIREVLAKINEGQALDVQRFGGGEKITGLQTVAELERYTYLVAGAVGEFWTRVCSRHLPAFADRPREQMLAWGIEYGKGLQLINILRDVGSDLRAGRCYLPADELRALGSAPAELLREAAPAAPMLQSWRERAGQGMAAGVEYACAIRPWRVRFATALPALIGARTLALLRAGGVAVFESRIKMSRPEVKRILFEMALSLASPRAIRKAHRRLSSM